MTPADDTFTYTGDDLAAGGVRLGDLAREHGTPLYVYDGDAVRARFARLRRAFAAGTDLLVAYSVKANPSLAVIRLLAREGAGADVVSGGEMARALRAGVPPERVVFSGAGKRDDELAAALDAGILCFNVEAEAELEALSRLAAARGVRAGVALRVNPDTDARTHHYIATGKRVNKFGVPWERAHDLYRRAAALPGIAPRGLDCHIGSQLTSLDPFAEALGRVRDLALALRKDGLPLDLLDVGGGLGVRYTDERPPAVEDYARTVLEALGDLGARLVLEPGRWLVAEAGALVTRVLYAKENRGKRFLVVDAGMNDLMRPALYGAQHGLLPVRRGGGAVVADVVGPLCETGDFLVAGREVPDAAPGDLLAVLGAGAYARSMASNYNSRPRAAEVLVLDGAAHLVQARETIDDLLARERIPSCLA
ncbi:MAG: diaminopimelate decarboxylase [Planctomycetes bacterium]|nr:diaminopimelate decarboxylase [Planctomycetota bacterium]